MKKFLDINIEDKFKVKTELVLTGIINSKYYGKIESGNYLKFNFKENVITRKIIGVDYFTIPFYLSLDEVKTRNVGLLIEFENEKELKGILDSKTLRQVAEIYKD
ncbi:hypothetical protein [uncultured Lacinutrix sp.]|uniref:hypothetical protein n=1 Tax=uncultured Lacinutrix sp. TaxID=574032 RepID=UPI00261DCCC7|nr:hypothetical protein [uncultured Lacinutrix sp.]